MNWDRRCLPLFCSKIPTIGPYIQKPFKIALEKQKDKLHRKPGQGGSTTSVSKIFVPSINNFLCMSWFLILFSNDIPFCVIKLIWPVVQCTSPYSKVLKSAVEMFGVFDKFCLCFRGKELWNCLLNKELKNFKLRRIHKNPVLRL